MTYEASRTPVYGPLFCLASFRLSPSVGRFLRLACWILVATVTLSGLACKSSSEPGTAPPSGAAWQQENTRALQALLDESKSSSRTVLLLGSADWCGPCTMMKKEVLEDPQVRAYLAENVTVYVVDRGENAALAKESNIITLPTLVAYRDGQELDRRVGFLDAEALLAWLRGLPEGEPWIATQQLSPDATERERAEFADLLITHGAFERAELLLDEIWRTAKAPDPRSRAGTNIVAMMAHLSVVHEPANARFSAYSDLPRMRYRRFQRRWRWILSKWGSA